MLLAQLVQHTVLDTTEQWSTPRFAALAEQSRTESNNAGDSTLTRHTASDYQCLMVAC
jgi:hypothetical protein